MTTLTREEVIQENEDAKQRAQDAVVRQIQRQERAARIEYVIRQFNYEENTH